MNIFILGSGGREHALAWKASLNEDVNNVFIIPGNAGAALTNKVKLIDFDPSDRMSLKAALLEYKPELTIIGPEKLLDSGITDYIEDLGFLAFGPSGSASILESSKIFAKDFMFKRDIPTAKYKTYKTAENAINDLESWDFEKGIVLKADELASGKGVVVTHDRVEAKKVIDDFMLNPDCVVKTKSLLIEEKLVGREVSAFAICDGAEFIELGYVCDYKAAKDGNKGPNTGGMGCFTPKGWPSDTCKKFIREQIFSKVLKGMSDEGKPFKGVLFAGLMVKDNRASVIEFNVRFGDPETQTLLPLIEGDFLTTLLQASKGKLKQEKLIKESEQTSVHVVMASGGYPSIDKTPLSLDHKIHWNENNQKETNLFFAGVKKSQSEDSLVNSGGRVLGITASANSLEEARQRAYFEIDKINFKDAHWRSDIGL